MSPIVDETLKSDLIMSKQIRQATSKILQRPSQFNGYKSKQTRNDLERTLKPILNSSLKPVLPIKLKTNQEEICFDKTFKSNIENPSRLSNYEYAFDQLHKQSNLYEEIDKFSPPSLPKRNKLYAQVNKASSNNARDKKMTNDIFQLGREPSVDHCKPKSRTYNTLILKPLQLLKKKTLTPEQETPPEVPSRKCPDPNLYEDLLELQQFRVKSPDPNRFESNFEHCDKKSRPFQRIESGLFSCFTSMVPWCVMRRIYWKK